MIKHSTINYQLKNNHGHAKTCCVHAWVVKNKEQLQVTGIINYFKKFY
jgi:hypothetical protein